MALFGAAPALDEFIGGDNRQAAPLDLSRPKDWQAQLATISKAPPPLDALALPAFSLLRGGDLFERPKAKIPPRTAPELLLAWRGRLQVVPNKVAATECEAAQNGVCRVLAGNPAIARRLLLAKPIRMVLIPKRRDFREYGFPPHTNPSAAGIFWNGKSEPVALLGLREEHVAERPWLMVHEMTHAVHLLALTSNERTILDQALLPVYQNPRVVEEALAIYAERAFGATYGPRDLEAPGWYGKIRRDWHPDHLFALFLKELLKP